MSEFEHDLYDDSSSDASLFYMKKKDGYIKIECSVPPELQEIVGKTRTNVAVYESSFTPNHFIKDAITGIKTPFKIGSKEEEYFFKVKLANGMNGNKQPSNLYFRSPWDFEKHMYEKLDQDFKNDWSNRKYELIRKNAKLANRTEEEEIMQVFTKNKKRVVFVK